LTLAEAPPFWVPRPERDTSRKMETTAKSEEAEFGTRRRWV